MAAGFIANTVSLPLCLKIPHVTLFQAREISKKPPNCAISERSLMANQYLDCMAMGAFRRDPLSTTLSLF